MKKNETNSRLKNTYVQRGIFLQGIQPLVFCETLGNDSFLDLPHAEFHAQFVILICIIRTAST